MWISQVFTALDERHLHEMVGIVATHIVLPFFVFFLRRFRLNAGSHLSMPAVSTSCR